MPPLSASRPLADSVPPSHLTTDVFSPLPLYLQELQAVCTESPTSTATPSSPGQGGDGKPMIMRGPDLALVRVDSVHNACVILDLPKPLGKPEPRFRVCHDTDALPMSAGVPR